MAFVFCCPECDFFCSQEPKFIAHLVDIHHVDDIQAYYCIHVFQKEPPQCKCGCKIVLPFSGWKNGFASFTQGLGFVRGHNARASTSFTNPDVIKRMCEKRNESLKTDKAKVWNKGLTKETDERVAASARNISKSLQVGYAEGLIIDWHAKDPEKAKLAAEKSSKTKQRKFASGELCSWNVGLTKETDIRVSLQSLAIAQNYIENPGASAKRLSSEDVLQRLTEIKNVTLISDVSDYRNKYTKLTLQCKRCNHVFQRSLMHLQNSSVCLKCSPKESKGQLEMFEFVLSLSLDAVLSDRTEIKPKELDIWVPSKRFAIEYNGLYWHSELNVSDSFHEEKSNFCKDQKIKLLHIFEDEWENRQEIVKSVIRSRLGCVLSKFMARKCVVRKIDAKVRRQFFETNHLEGDVKATIAWGLFMGDELLSSLSLRKPKGTKYEGFFEVARFASKLNISVSGALSKLVSIAKNWTDESGLRGLMTYVDTRFGDAHGYEASGFTQIGKTPRRFWWVEGKKRVHRLTYKANKEKGLSENQVAELAGVTRIWCCPNIVLVRT